LDVKFRLDGAPGTVSSSRSCRRSRVSAAGLGRDGEERGAFFAAGRGEAVRAGVDAGRGEAEVRRCAAGVAVLVRDFEAVLREGFVVLRAPRDVLRAPRDAGRAVCRRAVDFFERWRAFAFCADRDARRVAVLLVLRPALRGPAFALRFAITNVLSVPRVHSREDPRHP
jgi:hypothetical protein